MCFLEGERVKLLRVDSHRAARSEFWWFIMEVFFPFLYLSHYDSSITPPPEPPPPPLSSLLLPHTLQPSVPRWICDVTRLGKRGFLVTLDRSNPTFGGLKLSPSLSSKPKETYAHREIDGVYNRRNFTGKNEGKFHNSIILISLKLIDGILKK